MIEAAGCVYLHYVLILKIIILKALRLSCGVIVILLTSYSGACCRIIEMLLVISASILDECAN